MLAAGRAGVASGRWSIGSAFVDAQADASPVTRSAPGVKSSVDAGESQTGWCGTSWERENERSPAPARLYPVTRQPPLIGAQLYSPYPPAERLRLGTGEMASPCGGALVARDGDGIVSYIAPG